MGAIDEEELARRTNPIITIIERRKEEKEWSSAEVMRILRKRASKRLQSSPIAGDGGSEGPDGVGTPRNRS